MLVTLMFLVVAKKSRGSIARQLVQAGLVKYSMSQIPCSVYAQQLAKGWIFFFPQELELFHEFFFLCEISRNY